ncbi:MAG: hypothetical protein ACTSR8_13150 [Promethearchaeota archaeon]
MLLSKLQRDLEILVFIYEMNGLATSSIIQKAFKMSYAEVYKLMKKWEKPEDHFKDIDILIDKKVIKITKIPPEELTLGGPQVKYSLNDYGIYFLQSLKPILEKISGKVYDTPTQIDNRRFEEKLKKIILNFENELDIILKEFEFKPFDNNRRKFKENILQYFYNLL